MGEWAVTWTCFSSLLRWFILNSLACQGPQVQGLSEVLIFPRQDFWELLTWVGSRSPVAITPASVNLRVVHLVWPFFLPPPPYFHISVYFVSFMHAYDELCSSSHSNTLFHTPLYLLFLSVSPPTSPHPHSSHDVFMIPITTSYPERQDPFHHWHLQSLQFLFFLVPWALEWVLIPSRGLRTQHSLILRTVASYTPLH